MTRMFAVCWDIAQSHDNSIVMISENINGQVFIQDIIKLPARTGYVDQCEMVANLHKSYPGELTIDSTGVGKGPADILRKMGVAVNEVQWTGGDKESRANGKINLPKSIGVMLTTLLIQSKNLKVTMFCSNKDLLKRELSEFSARTNASGRTTFNGAGSHDDCVSALMLTAWTWSKKNSNGPAAIIMGARNPADSHPIMSSYSYSAGGGVTGTGRFRL